MEATAHTIESRDGLALKVWDYGGDGPPLLCCHCTGTLGRIWDPVVALLGDRFRVIAPDTRGQGDSERPADYDAFDWRHSGQDLLQILDALGIESPVRAVGHSAGSAQIAYAEHFRPGTFERAVLIDPIIGPRAAFQGERPLAKLVRKRINDFESLEDARARYVAKPPMRTWTPETVDAYMAHAFVAREDGGITLKCPGNVEAYFYEHGGVCDIYEVLGALAFEVLLVTGSESNVKALVEHQATRLRHVELRAVKGASHFIPQEQPELIATWIREWFGA